MIPIPGINSLKLAGIAVLATLLIGGVAGGWWHIKTVTEMKAEHRMEVNYLKAKAEWNEQTHAKLNDELVIRDARITLLKGKLERASVAMEELKKNDEASADYLNDPVPERVQLLSRETACSILPASCEFSPIAGDEDQDNAGEEQSRGT